MNRQLILYQNKLLNAEGECDARPEKGRSIRVVYGLPIGVTRQAWVQRLQTLTREWDQWLGHHHNYLSGTQSVWAERTVWVLAKQKHNTKCILK